MKRKMLCVIMMLVMLVGSVFIPDTVSLAAENTNNDESMTYGSFAYEMYDDNSVIITDYLPFSKETVVPSHVNGYPVVALGEKAFENAAVKEFVLPDTLEIIEDFAFQYSNIETLNIPKNVREIGKGISFQSDLKFYTVDEDSEYLKAIDGVLFSKDGKVLESYPYMYNDKRENYESYYGVIYKVPQGVEYIGAGAFYHTAFLEYVIFPEGLKGIEEQAFYDCYSLREISWPSSLEYIDYQAFAECDNLSSLYGYDNFLFIAHDAFLNTPWYKNHPSGAIYLGRVLYSFKHTGQAGYVEKIPEGTIRIEANAFKYGSPVTLVIPESMEYIDLTAFRGSHNMEKIVVDENNPYYSSVGDMLFDKDKKILLSCPRGMRYTVNIPEGTEIIYPEAFRGGSLGLAVIPESVYYIGESAFEACGSMNYVYFLEGVEYIGDNAFKDCLSLKEINMPESVIHLGSDVFDGCRAVSSVVFPEGSILYNKDSFEDTYWYRKPNNRLFVGNGCVLAYKGNIFEDKVVDVPEGVLTISTMAFADTDHLVGVVLPDTLKRIGPCAFENCPKLTEITIPASVDEIYPYALGYTYVEGETESEGEHFPVEGFVIKGYTNSVAEVYAIENGFEFVSVGELEVSELLGDTDMDDSVTIKDATAIQKYLVALKLFVSQQKINADMNSDGDVNIKDATAIQKHLAGLDF